MRHLLPVFCLIALSGCATSVQELHDLNPPADNFNSSLASEYRDYADSEYEQGRIFSAEHFAGKGLTAAKGEAVEPDVLDSGLPEPVADGRAQLVKFLNDDIKRVSPQKLAHGQLLFDCWQNELHKNLNQEKAPCDEEFHSTMAELQEVSDALVYGKESDHVIIFAAHSTKLDAQGLAAIKDVAQKVAGLPHYRVMLVAYTGRGVKQRHVTETRIAAVHHALVKAGVSDKHIRIKKEGGAKAVVLSADHIAMNTKKITIIVKTTHDKKTQG